MSNRIIPNRPASREAYKPKQKQEKESALDFFKDTWNKREAFANDTKTVTTEEYLRNLSVKNSYGTGWTPVRNTTKDLPLKDLMNSVSECIVITKDSDVAVSVSACNRVEKIETYSKTLEYVNCVKVVENTESKYDMRVRNGYKVYDLYKYDHVWQKDLVYMTVAVR